MDNSSQRMLYETRRTVSERWKCERDNRFTLSAIAKVMIHIISAIRKKINKDYKTLGDKAKWLCYKLADIHSKSKFSGEGVNSICRNRDGELLPKRPDISIGQYNVAGLIEHRDRSHEVISDKPLKPVLKRMNKKCKTKEYNGPRKVFYEACYILRFY